MKGDDKVIDYLNRGLRWELTAISQFWLHHNLQKNWGFGRAAEKSRVESIEEMRQADRMIERIVFLDGHPNLQKLEPLRIGENLRESLDADMALEVEAHALYIEAREHCRTVQDFVSMRLFEGHIADQEEHIDFLETQIDLYDTLGAQNYGQLNATPANEHA